MADDIKVTQVHGQLAARPDPSDIKVTQVHGQLAARPDPSYIKVTQLCVQAAVYPSTGPTGLTGMAQLMRHGKWFSTGGEQPFWWAK